MKRFSGFFKFKIYTVRGVRFAERGNFLMQALLAIALIMAFMPLISRKQAEQKMDTQMNAVAEQIGAVSTAARIFLREEFDDLKYGRTVLSGGDFSDALEPMGLPLGFVPRTPFGAEISFVISKQDNGAVALIVIPGGDMSETRRAELGRRIGFWAGYTDNDSRLMAYDGSWEINLAEFNISPDKNTIYVRVPMDAEFSEIVRRRENNPDVNSFLADLDMDNFNIRGIAAVAAVTGNFGAVLSDNIVLFGEEDGRKIRNNLESITSSKAVFRAADGEAALSISKNTLVADNMYARTISGFGDSGNLYANSISVYDFSMSAGASDFNGPARWDIKENAVLENVTLSVDNLEVGSVLNTARAQNVYFDDDGYTYSVKSGIETDSITASHITLRDQVSSGLNAGQTGAVILDVRPSGVSVLPDAFIAGINNESFKIISEIDDDTGQFISCRDVISRLYNNPAVADLSPYNARSLTQNIVCQYVFWQRLERRIDFKQCMLDGKGGCTP